MKSLKSKFDFYQNLLGLQDWRITLKENCKPDDLTIGSGHAGCSVFQEAEKVAVIEIVAPEHCGETVEPVDTERVLVHELLHLKFSLLCSVNDPDNDVQSRLVHQIIDDMARAIVGARRSEEAEDE